MEKIILCSTKWLLVLVIVFVFLDAVEGNCELLYKRVYVFVCNRIFFVTGDGRLRQLEREIYIMVALRARIGLVSSPFIRKA
jgi:hypothetical protein